MINIRKNAVNFWWLCNISQYLSVRNVFSLAQEKNAYALREKQSTSIYITRSIETIRSAIFVMSGPLRSISNAKIIVITFVTSANAMANARYTSFWACKNYFYGLTAFYCELVWLLLLLLLLLYFDYYDSDRCFVVEAKTASNKFINFSNRLVSVASKMIGVNVIRLMSNSVRWHTIHRHNFT